MCSAGKITLFSSNKYWKKEKDFQHTTGLTREESIDLKYLLEYTFL